MAIFSRKLAASADGVRHVHSKGVMMVKPFLSPRRLRVVRAGHSIVRGLKLCERVMHRASASGGLALLFVGLAACGAGPTAAGSPAVVVDRSAAHSLPHTPSKLARAAKAIGKLGRSRFPDNYAGHAFVDQQTRLVVYRKTAGELDEVLVRRYSKLPITTRDAPYSFAELEEAVSAVLGDGAYWSERGVRIITIEAAAERGVVVSAAAAAALRPAFEERYGGTVTVVEPTETPDHPGPYIPSR